MKRKTSRLAEVPVAGSTRRLSSASLPVPGAGAGFVVPLPPGATGAVPAGFAAEEVRRLLTVVREALR